MAIAEQARVQRIPGHFSGGRQAEGARVPASLVDRQPSSPVPDATHPVAPASYGQVEKFAQEHPFDIDALRMYAWRIGAPGVFAYMISPVKGFDTEAGYLLSQVRSYWDMYAPHGEEAAPRWETEQIVKTPLTPAWKITADGWELDIPEEFRVARDRALALKQQHQEYQRAQQTAREAQRAAYEVPYGTDIFGNVLPLPGNVTKMAARIERDARLAEKAGEPVTFNKRVDEVARQLNLTAIHETNSVARVATFMTEFSPLATAAEVSLEQVQGVFTQVAQVVRNVIERGDRADLEHVWFVFTRDSRDPMPRHDDDIRAALTARIDKAQAVIAEKIAQRRVSNPHVPWFITQAFTRDIPIKTVPVLTPQPEAAPSHDNSDHRSSESVPAAVSFIADTGMTDHSEASAQQRRGIRLFRRKERPAVEPKSPPRFYYGWRKNPDPQYDEARTQH